MDWAFLTSLGLWRVASAPPPHCIFVASGPITITFCIGIDHQGVSMNMNQDLHKIIDVIVNDVHYTETSVVCPKMHKTENMKNSINSIVNGHIMVNFCTGMVRYNTIPHAK